MIEVYHAKHPTFRGANGPLNKDAFEKVATVTTHDLDEAYRLTNHIDRAWWDNPEVRLHGATKYRSTSVGDVLVDGDDVYTVAPFGFHPVRWA